MQDPKSAKVSKGLDSPRLKGKLDFLKIACLVGSWFDGIDRIMDIGRALGHVSAPVIRSLMAFKTTSILLVILPCSCLKSASNLENLASQDAIKLDTNPSRFD
ncbi:hypothetical protein Tco_1007651 [Tanacetum coccineum]